MTSLFGSAQACFEHCLPIVTVYATLGEEALRFSFEQTKLAAVITEAALLETVVASSVECRQLKLIVYFDHVDEAKRKVFNVFTFDMLCVLSVSTLYV